MVAFVRRRALLRGPFGGSRQWTVLWALLLAVRLVRRLTRDKPEVVPVSYTHLTLPTNREV